MTLALTDQAEFSVDSSLVRALLEEQHPDLAALTLVEISSGWDNRIYRLGKDLAVRLPHRAVSAPLIEHEQRWLPQLSVRLPLPIPVPVRVGRPGCGFPWPWSVVPWLAGQRASLAPLDPELMAIALGQFLRSLHQPAPDEAPRNPWRGVPLAARNETLQEHLKQLSQAVDQAAVLRLWEQALAAPCWPGPPLWIHGDLHPGNLLVADGRLSAVIDFGDLTAGDPATDLSVAYMLLPAAARSAFYDSARGRSDPVDKHTRLRARGWAVALGVAWLASGRSDSAMRAIARKAIDAALSD